MALNVVATPLPDVLIVEPERFDDERGFFMESFNQRDFEAATGQRPCFVQDNHSYSQARVMRGLHYQVGAPQAKLVRVVAGEVFDVVLDVRRDQPSFGRWFGTALSAANRRQLWIPAGFAHGFLVTSAAAEVLYKTTAHRDPRAARTVNCWDAALAIDWPLARSEAVMAARDRDAPPLALAEAL